MSKTITKPVSKKAAATMTILRKRTGELQESGMILSCDTFDVTDTANGLEFMDTNDRSVVEVCRSRDINVIVATIVYNGHWHPIINEQLTANEFMSIQNVCMILEHGRKIESNRDHMTDAKFEFDNLWQVFADEFNTDHLVTDGKNSGEISQDIINAFLKYAA